MSRNAAVLLVLAGALAVPGPARGWGVPGCVNLPAYNRALGALQGMTSACDMSVEEARRVIAERDGPATMGQPGVPPPTPHRRRRRAPARHR